MMALSLALALLSAAAPAGDAILLESRIESVTVYADAARVTRVAAAVTADGRYIFAGLPDSMDPDNLRVRLSAGRVRSIQTRERWMKRAQEERLETLRAEILYLHREQQASRDEFALLKKLRGMIAGQLSADPDPKAPEPGLEAWQESHDYYSLALEELMGQERALRWEGEARLTRLAALEAELGRMDPEGRVRVFDVICDLDLGSEVGILSLEYLVDHCGWSPTYDLRTSGSAQELELVYRAQIVQQSGDDWSQVELALSTARPRRGAAGPEPRVRWVDLERRRGRYKNAPSAPASRYAGRPAMALSPSAAPPFARVQVAGLSVRFILPALESLASRPAATSVLVGEHTLELTPELYCLPALDETVWLRARSTNSSPFVLLPGPAAIFFGDDFIGNASLDEVQTGAEFSLDLGAVPGVSVERVLVSEEHIEPGFLSATSREVTRWRVRLANHGSPVTEADGSVRVIVREAIPRSRDERLEVSLSRSSPAFSEAERYKSDHADRSLVTWIIRVPAGGEADLNFELTLSHPDSKEVLLK